MQIAMAYNCKKPFFIDSPPNQANGISGNMSKQWQENSFVGKAALRWEFEGDEMIAGGRWQTGRVDF